MVAQVLDRNILRNRRHGADPFHSVLAVVASDAGPADSMQIALSAVGMRGRYPSRGNCPVVAVFAAGNDAVIATTERYYATSIFPISILCLIAISMPYSSYGQETADTRAIRALFDANQEAWASGDGRAVLANRDEHYFTAGVPRNNGRSDFHGVTVSDWSEESRKRFLGPDFGKGFAAAMADTAVDMKPRYALVRIDVNDDHAIAISRIEWARNDMTRNVRIRPGWASLWFLRKIDGQ